MSANILYTNTWKQMRFDNRKLHPHLVPLIDFSGITTYALGTTNLLLGWKSSSQFQRHLVTFVVVDCPTSYNVILDRPTLNIMKAQVCTFRNEMIVLILFGSWSIRGNLPVPQICYQTSLKHPAPPSPSLDEPELCLALFDQLEYFVLMLLTQTERSISVLLYHLNTTPNTRLNCQICIFICLDTTDLGSIPRSFMEHQLGISLSTKSIIQKCCSFNAEKQAILC